MNDSDIHKLIRDTGPYQATYIGNPINSKPGNCALPSLIPGSIDFPIPELPDITKLCTPLFTEFPISIDPFPLPESCPNGIVFTPKQVNIFNKVDAVNPAGSLIISANTQEDLCSYIVDFPDIVIPCYPSGPKLISTASITVIDPNSVSNSTTTYLSLAEDPNSACNWVLDGTVTINIPEVPCPNGIQFTNSTFKINSTCARPPETKRVVINKSQVNNCSYNVEFPDITIPCYPDGPNIHGNVNVTVKDPVNNFVVTTQSAGFVDSGCCDFQLDGDIEIPVPCANGIGFVTNQFNIRTPSWLTNNNQVVQLAPTPLEVSASNTSDICHFEINMPDITIPCYPDGIKFNGAIKFKTSDNVILSDTIDFNSVRDSEKPCSWDVGDIQIDLPTPNCPGGFTWSSNVTLKANANTTIPFATSGKRYHNIQLTNQPTKTPHDCGAALIGEINLGLPNFVLNCDALEVGSKSTLSLVVSGTTYATQLEATRCGFQFSNPVIELPVMSCPSGYNGSDTQVNVYLGNSTTPVPNSFVKLTPKNPASPQCGLALLGEIRIPNFAAGGFNFSPWVPSDYPTGTSVSIVYPEGAKCIYNSIAAATGSTVPGTPSGDDVWTSASCTGEKVYPPFKVIRAKPKTGTPNDYKKATVKIVPRSHLFKSLGSLEIEKIHGLDTLFTLGPSEVVYLEVILDGSNPYKPNVVYAAVAYGLHQDATIDTISQVGDEANYKLIRASEADILEKSQYPEITVANYIGLTEEQRAELVAKQREVLKKIATQTNDNRPYQLKAYIQIANTKTATDTSSLGNSEIATDVTLQKGTEVYSVYQLVNTHLVLGVKNVNNVPVVVIEKITGKKPKLTKLAKPTIEVVKTSRSVSGVMTDFANFKFILADQTAQDGTVYKMGPNSGDIHLYYTTDGTVPTINQMDNKKSELYDDTDTSNEGTMPGYIEIPLNSITYGIHVAAFSPFFDKSDNAVRLKTEIT